MTFHEYLKIFNDFLFAQSGMTNSLFDHVRFGREAPMSSLFFKPYKSKEEFFYKSASVVAAPICISIIALELITASFYLGLRTIVDLAQINTHRAKIHIIDAAFHMIFGVIAAITAVASPFINGVDWIGSGITTLTQKDEPQEEMKPAFK